MEFVCIGKSVDPDKGSVEGWVVGELTRTQTFGNSEAEVIGKMVLAGHVRVGFEVEREITVGGVIVARHLVGSIRSIDVDSAMVMVA